MVTKLAGVNGRIVRALGSNACWRFTYILLVLQGVWFALSAQYPMAFDEQFHFGLIQLHAKQWLPFFTSQPPTGAYGAAVRDPSYLYHWLMSFPYRGISLFTHDQTVQIVLLRLLNVALFAYALILYRQLLRRLGLSGALVNTSLLGFILIPVVPFLAATINYDNLLMVIVPLVTLLTLDVLDSLRAHRVPLPRVAVLLSLLLLGSLVKYPFLPVLVVIILFLLWHMWRQKLFTVKIWRRAWIGVRALHWARQLLLVLLLLLSIGLFAERYAINVVRYHTPVPDCGKVISQTECMQYGPWGRDHGYEQNKPATFRPDPAMYTGEWLHGMWYRLFFAIDYTYANDPPLYIISRIAIGVAVLFGLGIVLRLRWLFAGHPERVLLLLLILGYGAALFADNYAEYVRTAVAVAINGRYWIPFLPFFFGLGGLAWSDLLRRSPAIKTWSAVIVLAAFLLQGGGAMSYIVRSSDDWYWPNTQVRRVNGDIRTVVSPFIYGKDLPRPD